MIYIGIIAAIVIAERFIKGYIEKNRELGEETYICKRKIVIEKYHNFGVALNMLEKHATIVKIVTGTMIGLLLVALGMFIKEKDKTLYKLGLAMLLGGAISNWMDRLEKGYVVDYFRVNVGKRLKNIVFNLADMFVFLGGVFIIVAEMISSKK